MTEQCPRLPLSSPPFNTETSPFTPLDLLHHIHFPSLHYTTQHTPTTLIPLNCLSSSVHLRLFLLVYVAASPPHSTIHYCYMLPTDPSLSFFPLKHPLAVHFISRPSSSCSSHGLMRASRSARGRGEKCPQRQLSDNHFVSG